MYNVLFCIFGFNSWHFVTKPTKFQNKIYLFIVFLVYHLTSANNPNGNMETNVKKKISLVE